MGAVFDISMYGVLLSEVSRPAGSEISAVLALAAGCCILLMPASTPFKILPT